MTEQEVFDKVMKHLAKQKVPAQTSSGQCQYRIDGLKCAVGCLIPDELYKESLESKTVNHEHVRDLLIKEGIKCITLLAYLQLMHDSELNVTSFHNRAKQIALQFGLNSESVRLVKEWNGTTLEEEGK